MDSSIGSMDKILGLLKNHGDDRHRDYSQLKVFDAVYLAKFTHEFGKLVTKCRALTMITVRGVFLKYPEYVHDYPYKINELLDRISKDIELTHHPKSHAFFNVINPNKSLTYNQSIARYYLMNDIHCLHRVYADVRSVLTAFLGPTEDDDYHLPLVQIPPHHNLQGRDPLAIKTTEVNILQSGRETNMFVYILKDANVIDYSIIRYSKMHGQPNDAKFIMGLMNVMELEGQLTFEMLLKKILLKSLAERAEKIVSEDSYSFQRLEQKQEQKRYSRIEARKNSIGVMEAGDARKSSRLKRSETIKKRFEKLQYWDNVDERAQANFNDSGPRLVADLNCHNPKPIELIRHVTVHQNPLKQQGMEEPDDWERLPDLINDCDYSKVNCNLIIDKLLNDDKLVMKIKAIVAYKSGLHQKIYYSFNYKRSLARFKFDDYPSKMYFADFSKQDNQIIEMYNDHFDRFFGRYYFASPHKAEQWFLNFLFAYEALPELINDTLLQEAVDDYKLKINQCQIADVLNFKATNTNPKYRRELDDIRRMIAEYEPRDASNDRSTDPLDY